MAKQGAERPTRKILKLTFSMSGVEDKLGREKYIHDETEGLIP